jgi:eukaryotic-like serine/threonine-protein kinase
MVIEFKSLLVSLLATCAMLIGACTIMPVINADDDDDTEPDPIVEDDDDDEDVVVDATSCSELDDTTDMSAIDCGCFYMGDNFDEGDRDELPVHEVCLSSFLVDKTEVTNAAYAECVAAGECAEPAELGSGDRADYYGNPDYDNFPVVWVNWGDADTYCTWKGKRLLTEAEWEYAARGGQAGKRYPFGDELTGDDANYQDSGDEFDNNTTEVGSYPANDFGLFDMAGNVWEWTAEWFDSSFYSFRPDPDNDPYNDVPGDGYVVRGGSFSAGADNLRNSYRASDESNEVFDDEGFRCAAN